MRRILSGGPYRAGREGARQGLEEYLEVKYLCIGGLAA